MPTTIKNEQGEDIEVFTSEELEAQKEETRTEVLDKYKEENPDKTEEMENLQTELGEANAKIDEANEQIENLGKKDYNFGKARDEAKENASKQIEVAESKIKELQGTMDDKIKTQIGAAKEELQENFLQDHYNDLLQSAAEGDEEKRKKIELNYKRLNDPAGTKEQMSVRMATATLMSSDAPITDVLNTSVISSGGVAPLNLKEKEGSFSQEEKELGAKFGLEEKDFKK